MFISIKKYFLHFLLCIGIAALPYGVKAQDKNHIPDKGKFLDTLLYDRADYYRQLYPEISFLILQGGDETVEDMGSLSLLLGYQPKSLDYEHPSLLREELMIVTGNHLFFMLKNRLPSAFLFMADDPIISNAHICVLAIEPEAIATDAIQATEHLSGLPEKFIQKAPKDLLLHYGDYLAFVIDHEVYHCLQSMYVGPQLMSDKEHWGEYNHFLNEQGADAYAIGMNIKNKGKVSPFAKNIKRIRGLSIYSGDPDHMTYKSLEQVLKIPAEETSKMSAKEIFNMATRIKKQLTIDYDEYIQYLASAVQAMKELGVGELVNEELRNRVKNAQADQEKIKELVATSRQCLAELSGGEL